MDGVQLGFNYEEAVYFLIQGAIGILDMLQKKLKKKRKIFKLVFILLIQLIASFPGQIKFNKPNLSFSSYWTLVANTCKIDNFSSFIIVYL